MATVKARLAKLEEWAQMRRQPARQIVIRADRHVTDDEVDALLERKGIVPTPQDMILKLVTLYDESDCPLAEPTVLAVHALKSGATRP